MANFDKAYAKVMTWEGGYSCDPLDRGGETYCGITRRWYPNWAGWHLIDDHKKKLLFPDNLGGDVDLHRLVKEFYRVEYWDSVSFGQINDQTVAEELFDTAVNMGKRAAVNDLQRAYNLLNNNGRLGADLLTDGVIGTNTLKAVNGYPYPAAIAKVLNGLQFLRYLTITEKDPSQERFFRGWLKRVTM